MPRPRQPRARAPGPSGPRGKEMLSPSAARDRSGDRGALRGVRRERRDQLPAPARGGRRHRGAGEPASRRSSARACATSWSAPTSRRGRGVRMVADAVGQLGGIDSSSTTRASRSRVQARALERRLRQVLAVNLRTLPVRPRGDPTLLDEDSRARSLRLERPPADPEARLPRPSVSRADAEPTRTLALEYAGRGTA